MFSLATNMTKLFNLIVQNDYGSSKLLHSCLCSLQDIVYQINWPLNNIYNTMTNNGVAKCIMQSI